MLKTVKWQKDLVVSIKVEGGLFVLAQMRDNHLLEIFDFLVKTMIGRGWILMVRMCYLLFLYR